MTLFPIGAISETILHYQPPGWFLIGVSLIVLHKAVKFALFPSRSGARERHAWDQSDRNIVIICTMTVAGGFGLLYLALESF